MKNSSIEHGFYVQLQRDIDSVDEKADIYRAVYYSIRVALIALASFITVVSGWGGGDPSQMVLNLILSLGAISTGLTAIDTLFQVETKKNIYRLMLVELRELRSEFVFYYEHQSKDLEAVLKDKIYPKYQATKAYAKSLVEKESEKEDDVH